MYDASQDFEQAYEQVLREFPDTLGSEEDITAAMRRAEHRQDAKRRTLTRKLSTINSLTLIFGGLFILSLAAALLVMFGLAFVSPFMVRMHDLNLYDRYMELDLDMWLLFTLVLFGISISLLLVWKQPQKWRDQLDNLQWGLIHARHEPELPASILEVLQPKSGYHLYLTEHKRVYGAECVKVLGCAWILRSSGGPDIEEPLHREFLLKQE